MKPKVHARTCLTVLLALVPCLISACTTAAPPDAYQRDELVAVRHNSETDCTLLIYRDPSGQTLHIFRRHGVFELRLTFLHGGGFELIERGTQARVIADDEAHRVTKRINEMLDVKKPSEHLSSTTRTMP